MNFEGGDGVKNDEDEDDIYKDIGDFHFDKELSKLEESNKAYSEDISRLSEKLKVLTDKNKELKNVNDILATNISILMKTAKAEIDRKQRIIDELRKMPGGNGKQWGQIQSLDSCINCANLHNRTGDNINDIEEGEVKKNSDEINFEEDRKKISDFKGNMDCSDDLEKKEIHEKSRCRSREKHLSKHHREGARRSHSRHSGSTKGHHGYSPDSRKISYRDERSRRRDRSRSDLRCNTYKEDSSTHRKESHRKFHKRHRSSREKSSSRRTDRSSDRKKADGKSAEKKEATAEAGGENRQQKMDWTKDQIKEKCDLVKKLNLDEYHQKRNSSGEENRKNNDLFPRQSVLADLYEDCVTSSKLTGGRGMSDIHSTNKKNLEESEGSDGDGDDWPGKGTWIKPESTKPRTLYSKRMEAKLQQQMKEEALKLADSEKEREEETEKAEEVMDVCKEVLQDEKEEGEITFDEDDKIEAEEEKATNEKKTETLTVNGTFKNPVLRDNENEIEIKEFTPLKNNYKLEEISPSKPVAKQHILEYYNLKPSGQRLTNIEPEILDFSQTLPETPGKNFTHPFGIVEIADEKHTKNETKEKTDKPEDADKEFEEVEESVVLKPVPETPDVNKKCEPSDEGYGIRTRSKTGIGKQNIMETCPTQSGKRCTPQTRNRKRKVAYEDEESPPSKKKNKTENRVNGEEKEKDITTFEVFKSVSETVCDQAMIVTIEKANPEMKDKNDDAGDKQKIISAMGNSCDSSTFKVLRSYLMLSANDDSEMDAFSENSNCSSGEYSDSGASAFVDLL